MAPPPSSLYTLSFLIATLTTLFVAFSLRLLAILPATTRSKTANSKTPFRHKRPLASRVLIVLGSGGHTHEMFRLLRDLDTKKYTHRTYVVSSGDAFSAQRAAAFEREIQEREVARVKAEMEAREKEQQQEQQQQRSDGAGSSGSGKVEEEKQQQQQQHQNGATTGTTRPVMKLTNTEGHTSVLEIKSPVEGICEFPCIGPQHYDIAVVPRARKIHQPLLTTPLSCLNTLFACFGPLLCSTTTIARRRKPVTPYEIAAADAPDLIITNGPATAVIVILASLVLRFFDVKGVDTRGKCKTMYVESFARVKTLSLSGKLLLRVVDRFLVQWEELEGAGGRAEYWGVLV